MFIHCKQCESPNDDNAPCCTFCGNQLKAFEKHEPNYISTRGKRANVWIERCGLTAFCLAVAAVCWWQLTYDYGDDTPYDYAANAADYRKAEEEKRSYERQVKQYADFVKDFRDAPQADFDHLNRVFNSKLSKDHQKAIIETYRGGE